MSTAQKWIALGGTLAILLVIVFPSWQQTYQDHLLSYMGPWMVPLFAGVFLAAHFAVTFVLVWGVTWLIRRRDESSG
jgi:hypothetical protein